MKKLLSIVAPFSELEELVLPSQGCVQLTLLKHSDCASSIGLTITSSLLVIIRHWKALGGISRASPDSVQPTSSTFFGGANDSVLCT
jgi:hypothetical protein